MSLYVLDTDTVSLYQRGHPTVLQHFQLHVNDVATTVITVEEQLTGWYAKLRSTRRPDQLAAVYERLARTVQNLAHFRLLLFPEPAIRRFNNLLTLRLNIGRMDL